MPLFLSFFTKKKCLVDDPLVGSIAQEYLTNKEEHDKTAREWTKTQVVTIITIALDCLFFLYLDTPVNTLCIYTFKSPQHIFNIKDGTDIYIYGAQKIFFL